MQDQNEVTQPSAQAGRADFTQDNFTSRRTTGNNLFDAEALLTGEEEQAGFTYLNSHREYQSDQQREDIARGVIAASEVPKVAPRAFNQEVATKA